MFILIKLPKVSFHYNSSGSCFVSPNTVCPVLVLQAFRQWNVIASQPQPFMFAVALNQPVTYYSQPVINYKGTKWQLFLNRYPLGKC